jgi:hypothetical protein
MVFLQGFCPTRKYAVVSERAGDAPRSSEDDRIALWNEPTLRPSPCGFELRVLRAGEIARGAGRPLAQRGILSCCWSSFGSGRNRPPAHSASPALLPTHGARLRRCGQEPTQRVSVAACRAGSIAFKTIRGARDRFPSRAPLWVSVGVGEEAIGGADGPGL